MWRLTAGCLRRRSITKSWPLGLRAMPSRIAWRSSSSLSEARSGVHRSASSSWPEAHVHLAGAGHAHPIARFAEIVRHRRDEADPAAGLLDADVAGRAAGAIRQVGQRPARAKAGAHQRERQILVGAIAVDVAERHGLDQGEIEALGAAPGDHPVELVLVDALQRDHVDLDVQARGLRRRDALHHGLVLAPARDGRETASGPAYRARR